MWRVIFAFPILFAGLQMALCVLYFKEEPILYSIAKNKDNQARALIAKMYTTTNAKTEE